MPYADHRILSLVILVMMVSYYFSGLAIGGVLLYRFITQHPGRLSAVKTAGKNLVAYFSRHLILGLLVVIALVYFLPGMMYPALLMGSFLFASGAWLLFLFGLSKPHLRKAALSLRPNKKSAPYNLSWSASLQSNSKVQPLPSVSEAIAAGGSSPAASPAPSSPQPS
ncbi:hypothetical protein HAP99_01030, partial [Acidithiobacillus caldus]|uniref:hypothetical protein n=1 Tax=Acidithiobacillus caldus TaxID=33059 RepID=UPI001C066803